MHEPFVRGWYVYVMGGQCSRVALVGGSWEWELGSQTVVVMGVRSRTVGCGHRTGIADCWGNGSGIADCWGHRTGIADCWGNGSGIADSWGHPSGIADCLGHSLSAFWSAGRIAVNNTDARVTTLYGRPYGEGE